MFGDRRGPLPRADRARIKATPWEGQVLCGVRKGGETIFPFPAEQIPDLVESDGLLPNEVPCGRVVEAWSPAYYFMAPSLAPPSLPCPARRRSAPQRASSK